MLTMLVLLPVTLAILLLYVAWKSSYWQRRGVLGPPGWPLVGNMLKFATGQRSHGDVYAELYRDNPSLPYVGFYRLFNEPALLIRDQTLLRQILMGQNFVHCADNAFCLDSSLNQLAGYNPFIAKGERWRVLRGELLPLFTPRRVRQSLPHIVAACQELKEFVHKSLNTECFEAKDLATRYTLQVVGSAVFGLNAQTLRGPQEKKSRWLVLLGPLFQPSNWSLAETIALLHSPLLGSLLSYRYVPLSLQSWLRAMVDARSPDNNLLNMLKVEQNKDILGHASTLLLEGYETSAMLLAFALYELALHESCQLRVLAEINQVAHRNGGADGEELLTPEALAELEYAEAVLYETLRLHPAMQSLQKRCTQAFTLPAQTAGEESAKDGLRVPLDIVLIIPVQAIHHDPDLYDQPLSFQPERFMGTNKPGHMGCQFLGFGAGPRMCPGIRFGLTQVKAALVTLIQKYRIHLADQEQNQVEVSPITFLTASKRGIWLKLEKRQTSETSGI